MDYWELKVPTEISDIEETHTQLYKKVGRRYIPANDPWAADGLQEGIWLVIVRDYGKTIRAPVFPDRMRLSAALEEFREDFIKVLREAGEAYVTPRTRPITQKETEAIKAYHEVMGDEEHNSFIWTVKSISDIADEVIEKLKDRIAGRT